MYSLEDKKRAVELYVQYDLSCAAVINELGYPCRQQLRSWYKDFVVRGEVVLGGRPPKHAEQQRRAAVEHYLAHGRRDARTRRALGYPSSYQQLADWVDELAPGERRSPRSFPATSGEKVAAVAAPGSRPGTAAEVAEAHGVTRDTLYRWRYELVGRGATPTMGDAKTLPDDPAELKAMVESLRRQVAEPELRRDVLEGTIEILGKGPGADPNRLTDREKATLIGGLRGRRSLKDLLAALGMARSSYHYQARAMSAPDGLPEVRKRIRSIFDSSGGAYGRRRVHACLRAAGVTVSEKVIARVMAEEGLVARTSRRKRRHGSYQGEISKAPANLVRRDFHAGLPNFLWPADVTEFSIPAGKVYLSPIVDCFDGKIVSWSASTSPDAEMANSSLRAACAQLKGGERPWIHSDRGCHYRWPGWVAICEENGLTRSTSAKGRGPDDPACEGLFGRTRVEMFYGRDWSGAGIPEFMDGLGEYIEWHDEERIKMSLGGMSPNRYRSSMGPAA